MYKKNGADIKHHNNMASIDIVNSAYSNTTVHKSSTVESYLLSLTFYLILNYLMYVSIPILR